MSWPIHRVRHQLIIFWLFAYLVLNKTPVFWGISSRYIRQIAPLVLWTSLRFTTYLPSSATLPLTPLNPILKIRRTNLDSTSSWQVPKGRHQFITYPLGALYDLDPHLTLTFLPSSLPTFQRSSAPAYYDLYLYTTQRFYWLTGQRIWAALNSSLTNYHPMKWNRTDWRVDL